MQNIFTDFEHPTIRGGTKRKENTEFRRDKNLYQIFVRMVKRLHYIICFSRPA